MGSFLLPSTISRLSFKEKDYEVYYISDDLSFFHFFKWGPKVEIFIKFIKSIFKRIKIKNVIILVPLYFSLVFQISIDFMTFFFLF